MSLSAQWPWISTNFNSAPKTVIGIIVNTKHILRTKERNFVKTVVFHLSLLSQSVIGALITNIPAYLISHLPVNARIKHLFAILRTFGNHRLHIYQKFHSKHAAVRMRASIKFKIADQIYLSNVQNLFLFCFRI